MYNKKCSHIQILLVEINMNITTKVHKMQNIVR